MLWTELELLAAAQALGAGRIPESSTAESRLTKGLPEIPKKVISDLRRRIRAGDDPLGEIFSHIRSREFRRKLGATYTPLPIVRSMLDWAEQNGEPSRIIDPGVGSGRFLVGAGRRFPKASLVGVEVDPVAAMIARGHLACAGLTKRSTIMLADFRALSLEPTKGKTLYIGNPPYIRHHLIEPKWKEWLVREADKRGLKASQLAGLHVYFFLETVRAGRPGDYGAFITAAEWLNVNYGKLVRDLFLNGLGGKSISVVEPTAMPFPDAATTAAITTFSMGSKPKSIRMQRADELEDLGTLSGGRLVRRERFEAESRWGHLTRTARKVPPGYVELGELCRVHRGQVTGANKVWIEDDHCGDLPASVLYRTVTRARELFAAGSLLTKVDHLKNVVDLPEDLSVFSGSDRRAVDRFLKTARQMDANHSYTARHRRCWWSVGLREPAPILATYMARRPPIFVRNKGLARHINIAHGIYPREALPEKKLRALATYLSSKTLLSEGRTYAGGLTKFEPREMERILVPNPDLL